MLEPHFRLCGMNVHIDVFEGNSDEQDHNGKCTGGQDVPISFADRMKNDFVAHETAVDEKEHRIPVVFLNVRARGEQMDLHTGAAIVLLILHQLIQKILSENLKDAITKTACRRRRKNLETRTLQYEVNLRKRKGVVRAIRGDLTQLVRFRPKKFPAGGHVEEQGLHSDLRSARKSLFALGHQLAAGDFDRCTGGCLGLSFQYQARHRRNRWKSFATETQSLYGEQVVRLVKFACGMPAEARPGIFWGHTFAIIGN